MIGFVCRLLLSMSLVVTPVFAQQAIEDQPFATINGEPIAQSEYWQAFRSGIRNKFYHGKVPQAEIEAFAKEIAQQLIDERLLQAESLRRKVAPDTALVQSRLDAFEAQNKDKPIFQTHRDELLDNIRSQVEAKSRVEKLEEQVRESVQLSEQEVKAYYDANPDKFTEPEQVRVGLILIKVEPGAPNESWLAARDLSQELLARIQDGEDFADLAREFSNDPSAEQGGDMGYLHKGMLGGIAQTVVDKLEVGQVSEPVALLEGAALVKLLERQEAQKVSFEQARERATGLALQAKKDTEWQAFVEALRGRHEIRINEAIYARIGVAPGKDGDDTQSANPAD